MGNVGSRPEDPASVFMRDQTRLTVASLQITNAKKKTVLSITPNAFPSTRAVAKRDMGDDSLIEYVQDPNPNPTGLGLLLKIANEDELNFDFTFVVRQRRDESGTQADTNITGLTFILASNHQELDNLVTREFHADPNLHKHANVDFLGDYSTGGSPSVSFTWSWKWRPPKGVPEKSSGYRNTVAFVEYDQRAHKLSRLVEFSFWVQTPVNKPGTPLGLGLLDPRSMLSRQRVVSNQSTESGALSVVSDPLSEPMTPNLEATFDTMSPSSALAAKADPDCRRPGDDDIGDDGPLFRATMKEMESRTAVLRQRMKKVLRRAEHAKVALGQSNDALSMFIDSLREVTSHNNLGFKPALEEYFERFAKEMLRYEKQNESNLQKLIIEPMARLYSYDIKAAEAKKKEFDEESREFYAFVGRYLGMKSDSVTQKKKTESDSKYVAKKRNFEIKRHDYGSFMQDLHGGRKEQEMISHLSKYAEAQANSMLKAAKKVQDLQPQLETLLDEVQSSEKQLKIQRTEREERRRALEMGVPATGEDVDAITASVPSVSSAIPPPSVPIITTDSIAIQPERIPGDTSTIRTISTYGSSPPTVNESTTTIAPSVTSSLTPSQMPSPTLSTNANKFRGFRDLEEKDANGTSLSGSDRRKEGLLWALSRPGGHHDPKSLQKANWHKYWVVLAGGQLCEYSNWKEKLDLHNDPINLRMASVREARNQERRFCFEVITPQYKRVYQATSEEDMNNWITAINNAVKGMLEGGKSRTQFDASKLVDDPSKKDISKVFSNKNSLHHLSSGQMPLNSASASNNLQRRITVGSRPTYTRRSSTFNDDPEKLLQMIRDADAANSSCADCGSQVKTEWVSINLGIVLCIECSGIHRSLGTHISKVRSLTLDVTSFTPDLTELLLKIGNKKSNSVWEARLDSKEKLVPTASREARLKFITAKYITRNFVQPISSTLSMYPTADETLAAAVKKNDIPMALYALAIKGNPNLVDEKGVHLVWHALSASDLKKEKDLDTAETATTPTAGASTSKDGNKEPTFPMAELLLQNGGSIAAVNGSMTLPVSSYAKGYVSLKSAKAGGTETSYIPGSSSGTSSVTNGAGGVNSTGSTGGSGAQSGDERSKKESREDKLRKRVSTSGRIVKAQILDNLNVR